MKPKISTKRGGARLNSGRKSLNKPKIRFTMMIDIELLEGYGGKIGLKSYILASGKPKNEVPQPEKQVKHPIKAEKPNKSDTFLERRRQMVLGSIS